MNTAPGAPFDAAQGRRRPEPVSFAGRVAIVGGTGRLGSGMAKRLHRGGVGVLIGSRDPAKAQRAAASAGLPAQSGQANREAAAAADVVIVTVPYAAHRATLAEIDDAVSGKVVVVTTVPLDRGELIRPETGSAAQDAAALLPHSRVVAGFHTVSSAMLADLSRAPHGDVLLCGDDPAAKAIAADVARLMGLRPVDAGGLANAALLEQLAGLLLTLNRRYKKRDLGVHIVGLEDVEG
jgi:8-hydroxy-5-deazaflavin:NADPH oxidoreductase